MLRIKDTATACLITQLTVQALSSFANAQASTPFFAAPAPAPLAARVEAITPSGLSPISSSKDWRLYDEGTSCVAETVATSAGINHHLEIRVQKSPSSPLEVSIRSETATSPTVGFSATLDRAKTKIYTFAKLTPNGSEELFWNVPRGTADLISYLKREMKFDAQAIDSTGLTAQVVSFSLRGSSVTILDLGKKCALGLTVPTTVDSAFEKAFLPSAVAHIDVSRMTQTTADDLRRLISEARTAFMSSSDLQGEIEKLNATYLKQINELAGLHRNLDRLTQREVVRLESARIAAQNAIALAQIEIDNLRPQIGSTETSLIQANAEYETAYDLLKPLLPEYNRLVGVVRTHESRLNQSRNRLSSIESNLASTTSALRSLEQQAQSLRHSYAQAQNAEQNARADAQRATQDVRNFDTQREVRRRLSSDYRVDNIEREVQNFEQRIRAQERLASEADNERARLKGDLQMCEQQPGRDCTSERQRLSENERRLREARDEVRSLERAREEKRREVGAIRRQIQEEVNRAENELIRVEAVERARAQTAENQVRQFESELRAIEQIEIPTRSNDIARLNGERSIATQDLNDAGLSLRNANSALLTYRQKVGFDALESDVNAKQTRANAFKSVLEKIDRDIAKREKSKSDGAKELANIALEMEKTLAVIAVKESRSVEVQHALEPYELAKADLALKKLAADQKFAVAQSDFARQL